MSGDVGSDTGQVSPLDLVRLCGQLGFDEQGTYLALHVAIAESTQHHEDR